MVSAWEQVAGAPAESSHLHPQARAREASWDWLGNLKASPYRHTSSMATSPNPSQTVSATQDQGLKPDPMGFILIQSTAITTYD